MRVQGARFTRQPPFVRVTTESVVQQDLKTLYRRFRLLARKKRRPRHEDEEDDGKGAASKPSR